MKIEVGKTYKNGRGSPVYIECKMQYPTEMIKNYPYLGSGPVGGGIISYYNESGVEYRRDDPSSSLVPNKVKKEGWVNLYKGSIGTYAYAGQCALYSSEAEALRHHNSGERPRSYLEMYLGTKKVEWEEEE